ncbi:MAG: hypothetical protein AAGK57_05295 [Pseudomonadota bacterium]
MSPPHNPVGPYDPRVSHRALRGEVLTLAVQPDVAVFGVFDGGRYDAFAQTLDALGLRGLPLLTSDGEAAGAGPWIVDPYVDPKATGPDTPEADADDTAEAAAKAMADALAAGDETGGGALLTETSMHTPDPQDAALRTRVEALVSLDDMVPGGVFWIVPRHVTCQDLRAHLRKVARMVIPAAYLPEDPGTETAPVLFRHSQGDVLAEVLPALTPHQRRSVTGLAQALRFRAPSHPFETGGCLYRLDAPPDVDAAPLPLHLSADQMEQIGDAQLAGSRERVGQYLRDVDPSCAQRDRASLRAFVHRAEVAGDGMGLSSEQAHMKWAYLMAITDGGIDCPTTRTALHETEAHPDHRIDDIFAEVDALWEESAAG